MTFINGAPVQREDAVASSPCGALQELLAATRLLAGMPREVLAALGGDAVRWRHADGDTLFFEGDEARHCLLVAQGAVEVLRYDAAGDERMLHCFEVGQLVAEAAMFMPHGLYPMTARARGGTQVWRISRRALRGACERHPALALRLLESLSLRLYQRVNEVDWLTSSNAPQRLAAYLVSQAERQGLDIQLPTSQRHLAAHLGIRAETLNRILAEWQGKGWIRGGRRLWCLQDVAPLRALAAPAARAF
ncbi:Crp/Fnr family transcriptional regulator [Acidovorax sp. A79]|uniref:Crp/Fnr family transcriptional regulator n=1 Tax=Acidovorax sp. A79 TaxID=3056107 RepID=UPI0034E88746